MWQTKLPSKSPVRNVKCLFLLNRWFLQNCSHLCTQDQLKHGHGPSLRRSKDIEQESKAPCRLQSLCTVKPLKSKPPASIVSYHVPRKEWHPSPPVLAYITIWGGGGAYIHARGSLFAQESSRDSGSILQWLQCTWSYPVRYPEEVTDVQVISVTVEFLKYRIQGRQVSQEKSRTAKVRMSPQLHMGNQELQNDGDTEEPQEHAGMRV